jgi:hypothetical protein
MSVAFYICWPHIPAFVILPRIRMTADSRNVILYHRANDNQDIISLQAGQTLG